MKNEKIKKTIGLITLMSGLVVSLTGCSGADIKVYPKDENNLNEGLNIVVETDDLNDYDISINQKETGENQNSQNSNSNSSKTNNKTKGNYVVGINTNIIRVEYEQILSISGYDKNGETVWNYKTEKAPITEHDTVEVLDEFEDVLYFNDQGTICAIDKQTGNILWKNSDYQGVGTAYCFDDDRMYLMGGECLSLTIIDLNGNTVKKLGGFDKFYYVTDVFLVDDDKNLLELKLEGDSEYLGKDLDGVAISYYVQVNIKDETFKITGYDEVIDEETMEYQYVSVPNGKIYKCE